MIVRIGRDGKAVREENGTISQSLVVMDMEQMAMEYAPTEPGKRSGTAVVIMHCDQNYMGIRMGPALAKRGYHVLACGSIQSGEIERKFSLLNRYVKYLRSNPKIQKIVLMGHSGGATLMTAYQAIAENGVQIYQGKEMVYQCPLKEKLEPADGIMLLDANYGNGVMTLLSLDPAVLEEGNGLKLDPAYDLFDPLNGYDPNGVNYTRVFRKRFHAAQRDRNDRLIAMAQERLKKILAGEGNYVDDEPFFITAGNQPKPNNRFLPEDTQLLSHTKGEYDLLHGDGRVTHGQIRCVRTQEIDRSFSATYGVGVNKNTVKGFLSSQAIRTTAEFEVLEDGIAGIEWKSSYASPIGNIEEIHVPGLMMGMTGSYEYLAAEMIYQHAVRMEDKTIAFVHGADHNFAPNRQAETFPGEFGDTENTLYDYVADWMERLQ